MRIMVNDTTLFADVEGAGLVPDGQTMRERPTILALHGGPGFDHAYFKPSLSTLTDTAQVIYVDLRGQGRSERPPLETCTLEQMADDIAELGRELGLERPTILGHSAGGFVALHLVLRHPDVIGRLILVDTAAASADTGDAMARLEARAGLAARAAAERVFAGDFSSESMAEFGNLVMPAYVHDPATAGPAIEAIGRSGFSDKVASYYFQELAPHYDVRDRLGEISLPTLVVVGESDWLCTPSAGRTIAAAIPGSKLVVIPDAGHFPFSEQPEKFGDAVRAFLASEPAHQ